MRMGVQKSAHAEESLLPRSGRLRTISSRGSRFALSLTGFGAFLTLYAPQPLLPLFRQMFHASEFQVSLTISASVLGVALSAPLAGFVADHFGRKSVILTAMIGLGLTTTMATTATTLPALIAWRFLQGLFVPGILAVAMAYISEESPAEAVGATMATYVTGGVIGGFGGRFLTGLLAGPWGWEAGFLLLGIATLVSALAVGILLPPSRHFVRQHTAFLHVFAKHLRNPQLLATYAVGFNVLLTIVATFTYVNFYLADQPFQLGSSALSAIFAVYLLGAAITPTAGRLIDRFGYRRALIGAVGVSGAGMLLTLVPKLPVIIAGLTLLASGVFASQAAASIQVGRAARDARSSAAGLYLTLYYLGGAIGSAVPGLVWSHLGWPGCVAFVLLMQGLMAGIAYKQWTD
ncbi:MAG TPA: MFS transporter [Candidatus Acidoferrum sp.]|nr:MFS transporter [Candidatus Acidoferrum sp.]